MRTTNAIPCTRLAWVLVAALATPLTWGGASPGAPAPALAIDWHTSALDLDLRGMNGERYAFHCPPRAGLAGRLVGSGPYTDISSICVAAAHAGAIVSATGGIVTIEILPGNDDYAGSARHGVRSEALRAHWSGSFAVVQPAMPRGSP